MIIYPSRSIEQSNVIPYRSLLNGGQVCRLTHNIAATEAVILIIS